jgi:signal transduction histidine kinase
MNARSSRFFLVPGLRISLFVLLYVLLDALSFVHPFHGLSITPWNPNSGLAFAFLLRFGPRYWPVWAGAAIVADFVVRGSPFAFSMTVEIIAAAVYGGTAWLLLRPKGVDLSFPRPRDIIVFSLAIAGASLLVALSKVGISLYMLPIEAQWAGAMILRQWIGDLIGIALFAPFLILLESRGAASLRPTPERLAQAAAMIAVTALVFGWEATDEFRFFYLLFLPLIWVALRGGLLPTLETAVIAQCGVIAATTLRDLNDDTVVALQFVMLTIVLTGSLLGIDVDARKRAEADARERLGDLARLGRIYTTNEIASGLAHELKQPMLAIVNYVGAALRLLERSPPDQEEAIRLMRNTDAQVARADGIIRRMRDFVQRGESRIAPVDIGDVVREAKSLMAPLSRRHGISVEYRPEGSLPMVLVDEVQILQVIVNLLSNSIAAMAEADSPRRRIWVSARPSGTENIEIAVSDTGPGLSPDIANRLFEPFVTTRPEGVGIGLSISKSIVEAHDGRIWYDREAHGPGATFRFTLPIRGIDDER